MITPAYHRRNSLVCRRLVRHLHVWRWILWPR